jgi:Raf kinase inhibitor-like YbhB/YbcL family protein
VNITSTAFKHNENIPATYTCDGSDNVPPLTFSEIPSQAKSLALIVDDPDAPARAFTHWLIYNIPSTTTQIPENEVPDVSLQGKNDFGTTKYGGPCPHNGTHRYFFKLYALDVLLNLPEGASKRELEDAIEGHILESCQLIGLYKRTV